MLSIASLFFVDDLECPIFENENSHTRIEPNETRKAQISGIWYNSWVCMIIFPNQIAFGHIFRNNKTTCIFYVSFETTSECYYETRRTLIPI